MAATPEIDALIAEVARYKSSVRPEPIINAYKTYIDAWESITAAVPTAPGGVDTDVQFNDAGAFGGNAFFTYAKATGHAALGNTSALDTKTVLGISELLTGNLGALFERGIYVNNNYDNQGGGAVSVSGGAFYITVPDTAGAPANQLFAGDFFTDNEADSDVGVLGGVIIGVENNGNNNVTRIVGLEARLFLFDGNVITNAQGIIIKSPFDFSGAVDNSYGLYIEDQSNTGFGTIPDLIGFSKATVRIDPGLNGNFYNIRSNGAGSSNNLFEGNAEVDDVFVNLGVNRFTGPNSGVCAAFGSVGLGAYTSYPTTVLIDDAVTGIITTLGLNNALGIINSYSKTVAGAASINGIFCEPRVLSTSTDTLNNFIAVYGRAYCDSPHSIGAIFGGSFTAFVNNVATATTSRLVGAEAVVTNNSNVAGVLPYIAAFQTLWTNDGTQPVTNGYGIFVQGSGGVTAAVNTYGVFVANHTVAGAYNIFSDFTGAGAGGLNFFGTGMQIGATDLNISRIAANVLGIGTGATGSFAGSLKCAGVDVLGGAQFLTTHSALTNGAGALVGTLTNAPANGNPTKWIGINDNGTVRQIPAW